MPSNGWAMRRMLVWCGATRVGRQHGGAALDARLRSRGRRAGKQRRPLHLGAPGREADSRTRKVRADRADSVRERCDRARRTDRVGWPCRVQQRGLELRPRVSPGGALERDLGTAHAAPIIDVGRELAEMPEKPFALYGSSLTAMLRQRQKPPGTQRPAPCT